MRGRRGSWLKIWMNRLINSEKLKAKSFCIFLVDFIGWGVPFNFFIMWAKIEHTILYLSTQHLMKYTNSSVQNLYAMTKANYDQIFDKHVKQFYADIMRECKKGYFEAILCPYDYEDQCNEPLRAVYDAVEHIRTLFKGIKIVENDDNPGQMCDGYYFEASWDLDAIHSVKLNSADSLEEGTKDERTGASGENEPEQVSRHD